MLKGCIKIFIYTIIINLHQTEKMMQLPMKWRDKTWENLAYLWLVKSNVRLRLIRFQDPNQSKIPLRDVLFLCLKMCMRFSAVAFGILLFQSHKINQLTLCVLKNVFRVLCPNENFNICFKSHNDHLMSPPFPRILSWNIICQKKTHVRNVVDIFPIRGMVSIKYFEV